MDEKEREDRMAAAEALFMISHRGEKPQLPSRPRPTRRGKKQKVVDYDDITATKGKADTQTSKSRSRSLAKSNESANLLNERGRGRRGGSGSRGRGRGRVKAQNNSRRDRSYDGEPDNSQSIAMETENSTSPDSFDEEIPKPLKGKSKRKGGKTKARATKAQRKTSVASDTISAELKEPIDLAATKSDRQDTKDTSIIIYRPSESQQTSPSGNLPSLGLVSGFKQVSLATKSSTTTETTILPSFNLSEGNLLPSINLPSLPAELPFLQLPSQPTPNLSSLGDVVQPIDVDSQPDRGKSEKFLPLKKRKLHKTEESAGTPTTVAADSPVDGSSVSDTEERYDAVSPEPPRSPFTVQAPPIITMNTLMEIKTALQPDDDGDLPLHIAVVHENMRMVAKLISLMRIAGKHVDKFNKQQQTPLHLAIKLDFTEAVELLLKFGADVNAVDCSGSSAIHMAVQGRSTPILRLLLEKCPLAQLNNRNIEELLNIDGMESVNSFNGFRPVIQLQARLAVEFEPRITTGGIKSVSNFNGFRPVDQLRYNLNTELQ
ncbi:nuclear factor NF-kappa-b p100 subunit-like [Plakobranchus ocellatus]|uniref:Nuclear factor NF-kappa-b p100 subunit-like n=1 Tax=Plakobranchus ocellatus TaxID=259542 RepID=A0AAV4A607_9GAST|nr:nuclear factor NF-kappa-b p100 subunit-like [Plakobranchus ocellatus]